VRTRRKTERRVKKDKTKLERNGCGLRWRRGAVGKGLEEEPESIGPKSKSGTKEKGAKKNAWVHTNLATNTLGTGTGGGGTGWRSREA